MANPIGVVLATKKVAGALLKKFKKKSKSDFTKDKSGTITGVKPMSGKVPWYVGAGKTPEGRARIVKTHSQVKKN